MENELINVMSNDDLLAMKAKYPGNVSIATLIDGILATRKAEAEAIQVKDNFIAAVDKLLVVKEFKAGKTTVTTGLPKPPTDVHNLYLVWREVETPTGPEVSTEVTKQDGTKVVEMRQPVEKSYKWVAEVNKGFQVGRTTTTASGDNPTTSKRAITVNKRDGQVLKFVGNFPSASKACEFLKLDTGGDSATRVLTREGYFLDAYTGTDYTK